jgi:aminopeptidase N
MRLRCFAVLPRTLRTRVRAAAIDALRGARARKTVKSIIRLYESDGSYLVKAAAVRFFGVVGGSQMRARTESAKARPSPRHVVQRSADEALAQMAAL